MDGLLWNKHPSNPILAHPVGGFAFYDGTGEGVDPLLAECGVAKAGVDVLFRQNDKG